MSATDMDPVKEMGLCLSVGGSAQISLPSQHAEGTVHHTLLSRLGHEGCSHGYYSRTLWREAMYHTMRYCTWCPVM